MFKGFEEIQKAKENIPQVEQQQPDNTGNHVVTPPTEKFQPIGVGENNVITPTNTQAETVIPPVSEPQKPTDPYETKINEFNNLVNSKGSIAGLVEFLKPNKEDLERKQKVLEDRKKWQRIGEAFKLIADGVGVSSGALIPRREVGKELAQTDAEEKQLQTKFDADMDRYKQMMLKAKMQDKNDAFRNKLMLFNYQNKQDAQKKADADKKWQKQRIESQDRKNDERWKKTYDLQKKNHNLRMANVTRKSLHGGSGKEKPFITLSKTGKKVHISDPQIWGIVRSVRDDLAKKKADGTLTEKEKQDAMMVELLMGGNARKGYLDKNDMQSLRAIANEHFEEYFDVSDKATKGVYGLVPKKKKTFM